jgi:hypothetical protein
MSKLNVKIDKKSRKYRQYVIKKTAIFKIAIFIGMVCFGAMVSLMFPLRPTVSETEKRVLTTFPEWHLASFLNGTYFGQIDTWFADTFPFRDGLMTCSERFESLYGIRTEVIHGQVIAGDEIPEVAVDIDQLNNPQEESQAGAVTATSTTAMGNSESGQGIQTSVSAADVGTGVEDTDGSTNAQDGERLGSIFVVGNAAYNYYAFSQNASDEYVGVVNKLGECLSGKATLYDMIVPTSIDIALDDATRNSLTSSNQKKAILYMYSTMSPLVKKSYVYDILKSHRDEYLFFRTDHHWTALGAYYAYTSFISQLGKAATPLCLYEKMEFPGFKGSFFTQSAVTSLADNPDTVVAYKPLSTNKLQMANSDGTLMDYNIITDVSNWNATSKYSAFIGGDNPYTVITNPNLTDGSSCLVVKESFGNAFVPFLVDHFQNVYVVDYRYFDGTVSNLVDTYGIKTVLMLNNISATSTEQRISEMQRVCQ